MMKVFSVFALVLLVSGCAATDPTLDAMRNDPNFAPVLPELPEPELSSSGSLFRPELASSLYSDVKARRVGDIITVILRENTSASKSASTGISKATATDLQPIIGLGGANVNIGSQAVQLGVDSSQEYSGDASANQRNNLFGNIAVSVIKRLANGNLVIRGEKWLTLNNGDEYIRLTGIIRPQDIDPSNEILSTRIANAQIQYSGTGGFAEAQQQGWLSKFFNASWWPF